MITKEEAVRDYPLTDAGLANTASEKLTSINRDVAEFVNYDVDDPKIAAFEAEIIAFQNLPTDIELLGFVTEQTELKVICEDAIKTMIRDIMVRVGLKFKETQSKYTRFGTKGIHDMTNDELFACANRVHRVGTNLLTQIGGGLTTGMLSDLLAKNMSYHQIRLAQHSAIENRDDATEDRIEDGNALYKTMMDLCKIGQVIWANIDEAKHNDYIVYPSPEITPPVVPPTP
jgi:hypothetical protein